MVRLELSDTALAKLVAQAAADTAGVVRMAPSLGDRIKGAAVRAARQLTDAPAEDVRAADPAAVDIDGDDDGPLAVEVRIVARGEPPVIDTVSAVQRTVVAALREAGRDVTTVTVIVVDTEA